MDDQTSHSGGNTRFWENDMVREYERRQNLVSEKKEEVLTNIVRIVNYFVEQRSITTPRILDIGCGPGSPTTTSEYALAGIPGCSVVGVDASEQMIQAANSKMASQYGRRFSGFVSDFNSNTFWIPEIDNQYDFVISSGAFHYLSDFRRVPFLGEVQSRIRDGGLLVCGVGNLSSFPDIAEMEHRFRLEFTYNQIDKEKRPQTFSEFKAYFERTESGANINWKSHQTWLDAMREAGFKGVDIVWYLWVRTIFVALK